jgi:two-component system, chemotaxis family, chemotaxis protein CheY
MRHSSTILIVEDDADIREVMKIFLEADGYEVNVAADGLDALEQLKAGLSPDLILLDLMMPRLDGEQFVKQLRASRFANNVPVVLVSGCSSAERKAIELNAAYCLKKPVEAEQLLMTVRRFTLAQKDDAA